MQPGASTRILDIGGYFYDWEGVAPACPSITILNLAHPQGASVPPRYTCLAGDARKLPFPDQSFDVVYSNSVIEHVGNYEDQERFSSEVRRVGRRCFIQTPNRWFFIEPHFVSPFVHYLPRTLSKRLLRFLSLRSIFRSGDNVDLKQLAEEVRLLSFREMRNLFPDCEIHRETWAGLTKSFIAVRR
jgi:ubiquinone/menaquinone biosynthesis C-methylase UbiE